MKVCFIRLSAIGDVVHTLPALSLLKQCVPNLEVTWVVEELSASLLHNNKAIDQVIVLPKSKWQKCLTQPTRWSELAQDFRGLWQSLQVKEFDACLDLQGLLKSSIIAYLTKAPLRFGFANTRELADKFLTHRLDIGDYFDHHRPVVELNLELAKYFLNHLGITVPADYSANFPLPVSSLTDINKVETLLGGDKAKDSSYIVLIPGTTWDSKIWPHQNWVRLGELLLQRPDIRLVLIGGKGETKDNLYIHNEIQKRIGSKEKLVDLTGKTSLLELIPVFSKARLVFGGDTGPLHLAAATGNCTVIGIYGSTPAKRNGPYGKQCQTVNLGLDCQPCYTQNCPLGSKACLDTMSAEYVLEKSKILVEQALATR